MKHHLYTIMFLLPQTGLFPSPFSSLCPSPFFPLASLILWSVLCRYVFGLFLHLLSSNPLKPPSTLTAISLFHVSMPLYFVCQFILLRVHM